MDFRNSFEVFREVGFDINEGADMVMVKPGMIFRYNKKLNNLRYLFLLIKFLVNIV